MVMTRPQGWYGEDLHDIRRADGTARVRSVSRRFRMTLSGRDPGEGPGSSLEASMGSTSEYRVAVPQRLTDEVPFRASRVEVDLDHGRSRGTFVCFENPTPRQMRGSACCARARASGIPTVPRTERTTGCHPDDPLARKVVMTGA